MNAGLKQSVGEDKEYSPNICNAQQESVNARINRMQKTRITEQAELLALKSFLDQVPEAMTIIRLARKYGIN